MRAALPVVKLLPSATRAGAGAAAPPLRRTAELAAQVARVAAMQAMAGLLTEEEKGQEGDAWDVGWGGTGRPMRSPVATTAGARVRRTAAATACCWSNAATKGCHDSACRLRELS